jgi:hypothetical protein
MEISQKGKSDSIAQLLSKFRNVSIVLKSALRPSRTFSEPFVRVDGVDRFSMLRSSTCETRIEPLSQISDQFFSANFRSSISIPSAHLCEIVKDGIGNLNIKKRAEIHSGFADYIL